MAKLAGWLLALPRPAAWALCVAWCAFITWCSSRPASIEPSPWWWGVLSNGAHGPLFGLLACWIALLVPRECGWPALGTGARIGVCLAIAALGVADELHQSTVPGRDMSVLDVLTDVAGAAASLEIVAFLGRAERPAAGLGTRLALAALVSLGCGALATWVPVCFPDVRWF